MTAMPVATIGIPSSRSPARVLREGARVRRISVAVPLLRVAAHANLAAASALRIRPMLTPGKLREISHPDWLCDSHDFAEATGWRADRPAGTGTRPRVRQAGTGNAMTGNVDHWSTARSWRRLCAELSRARARTLRHRRGHGPAGRPRARFAAGDEPAARNRGQVRRLDPGQHPAGREDGQRPRAQIETLVRER